MKLLLVFELFYLYSLVDSQTNLRNLDNQKISSSDRYGTGHSRDGKVSAFCCYSEH